MNWKMIYLAKRNPKLAPEDFPQAWREHSALGAGCTNVRAKVLSVAQCSRVLQGPSLPGASDNYDGVNLLLLRDLQSAIDIWNDAETLAIMRPDEPRVFSTYVREFTLVCEESVIREAPRSGVVLVGFLRRSASLSREQWQAGFAHAQAQQTLVQGPFSQAVRVVANRVHLEPPPGYEYDSIVEWWFDSEDAARLAFSQSSDVRQSLSEALSSLCDLAGSVFMFTRVTHKRP